MFDETPTTGQVLGWAWENKDWILARLKGLRRWFRGKTKPPGNQGGILILGPGGVGKTTLARLLSGEIDLLLDGIERYDESIGIERYTLKDAPEVEVVVPPGQKHRRDVTWNDLHGDIADGKYRGIILVSAYGYHSLSQRSYKDFRSIKGTKASFLKEYLKRNRQDELGLLRNLRPHLKVNPGKLWFVSLIAKQDLWWPNHSDVEKHYRDGEYGNEIRRALRHKQAALRHEFVFSSLLIANFRTQNNELLRSNAAGYDNPRQVQSLRRLFETIDALKNWE